MKLCKVFRLRASFALFNYGNRPFGEGFKFDGLRVIALVTNSDRDECSKFFFRLSFGIVILRASGFFTIKF
jgi:hypothetical protein